MHLINKIIKQTSRQNVFELNFLDEISIEKKKFKNLGINSILKENTLFYFRLLESYNIPTVLIPNHEPDNKILVQQYEEFPVFMKIYNHADKHIAKVLKLQPGEKLNTPVFEFYFNYEDKVPVNESHLLSAGVLSVDESRLFIRLSSKVNAVLKSFFQRRDCHLAEFKLEFGKIGERFVISAVFTPFDLILLDKNLKPLFNLKSITPKVISSTFIAFKNLTIAK